VPRVSLHGVPLSWSGEEGLEDPLSDLLDAFGPAEPRDGVGAESGASIVLRRAKESDAADPSAEGHAPAFFQGVVQAFYERVAAPQTPSAFILWDRASRVRVPLDGAPIEAAIAPPEREIVPGSAAGMLHIALVIALRLEGLFHLHAAAIVHRGQSILIAGGSGAGKTTTAIALIEAGGDYLGDDALFLRDAGAGVEILAFPRAFHVGPATLRAFPRLAPFAHPRAAHPDKLAVDPREAFPGRARMTAPPPSTFLFPSIHSSLTETAPIEKADALGYLLASSAAVLIDGMPCRNENIALLRKLVQGALARGAMTREIRLGQDILTSPAEVIAANLELSLAKS
jgi:hypothetical protein